MALQGDLLVHGVPGDVNLEGLHPSEIEGLVLLEHLIGIAVHRIPGRQRPDQRVLGQDIAGLLGHLPHGGLPLGLAWIDAATGSHPPSKPRNPGIAVLEQQHPIIRPDHDQPYRPSSANRPIRRIIRDREATANLGAHSVSVRNPPKVRPMTVTIPAGLTTVTTHREGKAGQIWLDRLPALVAAACDRWDCRIDGEATHGQVALVVPVQHRRGPAMLKISLPHPGNLGEGAALRTYAGNGAVELYEADDTGLELVIERCRPSTLAERVVTTKQVRVEEAIEIAGDLARRLAVTPHDGPTITRLADTMPSWREELLHQVGCHPDALPRRAIQQALQTIEHLAGDETKTMLHGDLHFGNIMSADRQPWLAIDPKGWTGTAAFDAFTVIIGGRDGLAPGSRLDIEVTRRISRFATTAAVDPDLAAACCQTRAVSAYFYQLQLPDPGFDLELARALAAGRSDW